MYIRKNKNFIETSIKKNKSKKKKVLLTKILFYYINTSEIPIELFQKNVISSHVKITCYLFTHEGITAVTVT